MEVYLTVLSAARTSGLLGVYSLELLFSHTFTHSKIKPIQDEGCSSVSSFTDYQILIIASKTIAENDHILAFKMFKYY